MFEKLTAAPPDAILGLTEAFKKDPNPHKVNLGVGIYKDAQGKTPILKAVKRAEERIRLQESFGVDGFSGHCAAYGTAGVVPLCGAASALV